ncbi:MAG: amidohydrolase [Sedimentibacter sp.]|uniref:M20 metallopeptidase family protein n=1 Tax=Sedimentibacter sp. TaxID=1960295 RepID=UPI00315928A9
MDVRNLAQDVAADVVKWRRDLHQIPEVGQYLPQTSEYVCSQLDDMGVEYETGVGLESAIVATVKGNRNGMCIALRADMDGLPVKEETGLSFASVNGNMHACGHDAHTSIMLGAVKVLNQLKDQFSGTVKFLFQPAEEISAGAQPMIEGGALDGVDAIVGMHVGHISDEVKGGNALFSTGSMMACLDRFTLKVKGIGSHGAYPHNSRDPVVMAAHIITSLQEIISRELDPVDPGVITIGMVQGGSTYNVIPGDVYLEGTARAVNQKTREYLAGRIGEISENIAKGFRGSTEYKYFYGAPPLVNDEKFTLKVFESAGKAIGSDKVHLINKPVMGGEDFAYYLEKIPGTFIFLSTPMAVDGTVYPHHNSRFALGEEYFESGVAILVQSALDFLNE